MTCISSHAAGRPAPEPGFCIVGSRPYSGMTTPPRPPETRRDAVVSDSRCAGGVDGAATTERMCRRPLQHDVEHTVRDRHALIEGIQAVADEDVLDPALCPAVLVEHRGKIGAAMEHRSIGLVDRRPRHDEDAEAQLKMDWSS